MAEIRAVLETEEAELRRFPEAIRRYIETELDRCLHFYQTRSESG